MKKISFVAAFLLFTLGSSASAFAGQSCLTKEETKELFLLRMNLQQAQIKRPECKSAWGGMSCLPPIDMAQISYFEAKENGDHDACHVKEEVESSDIQ
jgi:hypothetical protein